MTALSTDVGPVCRRRPREASTAVREAGARDRSRGKAHDEVGVGGRARVGRTDEGRVRGSWGPRARKECDDDQAPDVTAGTADGVGDDDALGSGRGHGIVWRARRCHRSGWGWERRPGGFEPPPTRGTGEPIVPNLCEAPWEHVLEPREERGRGQRAGRPLTGTTITTPERDTTVGEVLEATAGDGDPEDIAPEVLEQLLLGARRLHVDHPIAGPALGGDLIAQVGPAQGVAHRAAKDGREDVAGEKKIGTRRRDPVRAVACESPTREKDVDVGVIRQVLPSGVQDGEDRRAGAHYPSQGD